MEAGGPSANPPHPAKSRLADIAGTLIAVVTLTLPVFFTAYYSTSNVVPPRLPAFRGHVDASPAQSYPL